MKQYLTTHEIKWGLLFFLFSLLWMGFERLMGWHGEHIDQHAIFTNLFIIFHIAIYVVALLEKRKKHFASGMTWWQGFLSGLGLTLVIVILAPLGQLITHELISPYYFENAIEYAARTGEKSRETLKANFNLQSYMFKSFIGGIIMGIITSAGVTVFVRKSPTA